jgi:hypothetical protein
MMAEPLPFPREPRPASEKLCKFAYELEAARNPAPLE